MVRVWLWMVLCCAVMADARMSASHFWEAMRNGHEAQAAAWTIYGKAPTFILMNEIVRFHLDPPQKPKETVALVPTHLTFKVAGVVQQRLCQAHFMTHLVRLAEGWRVDTEKTMDAWRHQRIKALKDCALKEMDEALQKGQEALQEWLKALGDLPKKVAPDPAEPNSNGNPGLPPPRSGERI